MASELEKITVVGTGGIGGTVAAFLKMAGENVTVVDASVPHVEAIRSAGLRVEGIRGDQRVAFEKVLLPEEVKGPLDLVFLAVKSQHTEAALATIAPHLSERGVIVSLQNGFNERRIAEVVGPSRTIGAMVHMVADFIGPGHIKRFTEGEFQIGEIDGRRTERLQKIAARLSPAVTTHTTTNIWGYLWAKQIFGCYLVATALVDAQSSEILKPEWSKRIFVALMGEAMEAALAEGVVVETYEGRNPVVMLVRSKEDLRCAFEALPAGSPKGNSGIWLDIKVRHRKTETEFVTGEVVRVGRKHGLPMAINARVAEMIKEIERGQIPMSWDNLRSLERFADARLPK